MSINLLLISSYTIVKLIEKPSEKIWEEIKWKEYESIIRNYCCRLQVYFTSPLTAEAHCDTEQGPVYDSLQTSLEDGNFDHVAHWVPEEQEEELKEYFDLGTDDSEG